MRGDEPHEFAKFVAREGTLMQGVAQADVRERFVALGLQPAGGSPDQFAALLQSELKK